MHTYSTGYGYKLLFACLRHKKIFIYYVGIFYRLHKNHIKFFIFFLDILLIDMKFNDGFQINSTHFHMNNCFFIIIF